jgi:hypothetical protein
VLSVFLRYTNSDYPFGIFKPFLPCVGVVISLISPYEVDVSLLDRCVRAFELKKNDIRFVFTPSCLQEG